jgi:hypothetical protein
MDWSVIGGLVGQAAPTIGSLLGGLIPFPGGAILGQVAGKIVAEALGVPPTPEAVHAAITTGDPATVNAGWRLPIPRCRRKSIVSRQRWRTCRTRAMSVWNTPRQIPRSNGRQA